MEMVDRFSSSFLKGTHMKKIFFGLILVAQFTSCINSSDIITEDMKKSLKNNLSGADDDDSLEGNQGGIKPLPTPTPFGADVPQVAPVMPPDPSPIGENQSCLTKNPDMLSKLGFNDAYIDCQWQLMHRKQTISKALPSSGSSYSFKGISGSDVQAYRAYELGYSGEGVNILITDDSFAKDHPDMQANYNKTLSVGCNNAVGSDPAAGLGQNHGVMVSGLAAAVGKNGIGVAGVAYRSKVSGHNVFACNSFSNSYNAPTGVHVWNASWGMPGNSVKATNAATLQAVESGINRGINYFVAAGNSRQPLEDSNFDSDNSPFIMHVAALNNQGKFTNYSSPGANIFVGSYGGLESGIDAPGTITTDRSSGGSFGYTTQMNGTSSASPVAAGVAAVLRSVNTSLTPIDIMCILAKTAIPTNVPKTSSSYGNVAIGVSGKEFINWSKNGHGYYHSFDIGFGKINLGGAVEMAKNYNKKLTLPVKYSFTKNSSTIPSSTDGNISIAAKSCASKTIDIKEDFQVFANEFSFDLSSSSLGNVIVFFTMPSRVKAQLKRYTGGTQGSGLSHAKKWKAMAAFGENAKGKWEIEICNSSGSGSIEWKDVKMEIYGFGNMQSIDVR